MKNLVAKILSVLARLILLKFKPVVVGITGSVGKTSTRDAVSAVLGDRFVLRPPIQNYNNEFGLPLTIIGSKSPGKNPVGWVLIFFKAMRTLIGGRYPQVLVLEMGSDRPGDISNLLKTTGQIDYAVITDIGISHLMNYPSAEALVKEKLSLLKGLKPNGVAVLNIDNENIRKFSNGKKPENIMTFGFSADADLSVADHQILQKDGTYNLMFKIKYKGTTVPAMIPQALGKSNIYAALAGAAVGVRLGMNLVEVSQALGNYQPPAGRLRLIKGIKNTRILDDSYNAAPSSTNLALDVLSQITPTGRKVAAIGGMAELGAQNETGHREVAAKIQEAGVKLVFLVGENAKIVQEELERRQFNGTVKWFEDSDSARIPVQNELMEGDTILIKGSQSARMEKIVKEIMADPESAEKLLVRQSEYWMNH